MPGVNVPETRYAKTADGVHIAYQVIGDGPGDLVFVPGFVYNIEQAWEWPHLARFARRLSSFSRLIQFDRRGTGLSDHIVPREAQLTLEARMDDIRAVMDAAGSERAALFGFEEAFALCAIFAATYPERVSALVAQARPGWVAGTRSGRGPSANRSGMSTSMVSGRDGDRWRSPSERDEWSGRTSAMTPSGSVSTRPSCADR